MTEYQRTTTARPSRRDADAGRRLRRRRPPASQHSVRTTDSEYVAAGPGGATLASRVVTFVFGILQVLLILRIVLLLLVANQGNDIVQLRCSASPSRSSSRSSACSR